MTKEEFLAKLESLRTFDFEFNGTTYLISLEKKTDSSGKEIQKIYFGEQYLPPQEYENFAHLMADCEIGFRYLREVIKSLDL